MNEIDQDFLKFRKKMEEKVRVSILVQWHTNKMCILNSSLQGHFKPSVLLFVALFSHIGFFYFAAWWVLWYFGNTWITWCLSAAFLTVSQAQAGWLQHDFGHHSVFQSTKLNHMVHDITICFMKVSLWMYCVDDVYKIVPIITAE